MSLRTFGWRNGIAGPVHRLAPALVLGWFSPPALAQEGRIWAGEFAVGATHPPPCLLACDSDPGYSRGLDARGEVSVDPRMSLYLGLSTYRLDYNSGLRYRPGRAMSAGVRLGLVDGKGAWLAGAFLLGQREYGDGGADGPPTLSGLGFGTELGAGWAIPVWKGVSAVPAVYYRSFSSDVTYTAGPAAGSTGRLSTRFYLLSLALRWQVGQRR